LILKAADYNERSAFSPLGDMYYEGKGTFQDFKDAKKWYKKAIDEGDEETVIYATAQLEKLNTN